MATAAAPAAAAESPSVIIVGAGLAGATAAWQLSDLAPRCSIVVLEARDRVGGRLVNSSSRSADLGAAWTWPSHDKQLAKAASAAGVKTVPQWKAGTTLVERASGKTITSSGTTFSEERRFVGGAVTIAAQLLMKSRARVLTNVVVQHVGQVAGGVEVMTRSTISGASSTHRARAIVMALPPAVLAESISFTPPLDPAVVEAQKRTPVWMGDTAKVVVSYADAFWRDNGLSGSAFSERGPLAQLWDNCDDELGVRDGGSIAGFCFGDDAKALARGGQDGDAVIKRVRTQLRTIFGDEAASPDSIDYCSWQASPWTAPQSALNAGHKRTPLGFGSEILRRPAFGGIVHFAGTETEDELGHMEGAVQSGCRVAEDIAYAVLAAKPKDTGLSL